MKRAQLLTRSVNKRLAIRFGLAFLLVVFFGTSSIRLFMENTATYYRILLMGDADNLVRFSPDQLKYIGQHISATEDRMLKELVISNIVVVVVFSFFSYLLSQGLFDSLASSVEREKRFLDDASHELRTPTAAIATISETTLRSPNTTPEDYKEALRQVQDEAKRLTSIINDLLLLSKFDNDRTDLNMERLELNGIITKVAKLSQIIANHKSIAIDVVIPTKRVMVNGDEDKLIRLLTVLVDNAIKYSETGSRILIRLEDKPKIKVSVKDFGQGIDSTDLPHIFERFYRSDYSRSDAGTGLGLSIAQRIAEAHGARIEVSSKKGKGSTFRLIF